VQTLVGLRLLAETCQRCPLARTRRNVGFGGVDGHLGVQADLMIIGEAPGEEEDAVGRPFEGLAGRQLAKLLIEAGLDRKAAYLTNVIKCRPTTASSGGSVTNRKPRSCEIAHCKDYLVAQIELVGPKVILAVGATSTAWLLGRGSRIEASRGGYQFREGIPVVATYHPSPVSLNRQAGRREMVLKDLSLVRRKLEDSAEASL
jgi:uracil-DNA glycosylase family 4